MKDVGNIVDRLKSLNIKVFNAMLSLSLLVALDLLAALHP